METWAIVLIVIICIVVIGAAVWFWWMRKNGKLGSKTTGGLKFRKHLKINGSGAGNDMVKLKNVKNGTEYVYGNNTVEGYCIIIDGVVIIKFGYWSESEKANEFGNNETTMDSVYDELYSHLKGKKKVPAIVPLCGNNIWHHVCLIPGLQKFQDVRKNIIKGKQLGLSSVAGLLEIISHATVLDYMRELCGENVIALSDRNFGPILNMTDEDVLKTYTDKEIPVAEGFVPNLWDKTFTALLKGELKSAKRITDITKLKTIAQSIEFYVGQLTDEHIKTTPYNILTTSVSKICDNFYELYKNGGFSAAFGNVDGVSVKDLQEYTPKEKDLDKSNYNYILECLGNNNVDNVRNNVALYFSNISSLTINNGVYCVNGRIVKNLGDEKKHFYKYIFSEDVTTLFENNTQLIEDIESIDYENEKNDENAENKKNTKEVKKKNIDVDMPTLTNILMAYQKLFNNEEKHDDIEATRDKYQELIDHIIRYKIGYENDTFEKVDTFVDLVKSKFDTLIYEENDFIQYANLGFICDSMLDLFKDYTEVLAVEDDSSEQIDYIGNAVLRVIDDFDNSVDAVTIIKLITLSKIILSLKNQIIQELLILPDALIPIFDHYFYFTVVLIADSFKYILNDFENENEKIDGWWNIYYLVEENIYCFIRLIFSYYNLSAITDDNYADIIEYTNSILNSCLEDEALPEFMDEDYTYSQNFLGSDTKEKIINKYNELYEILADITSYVISIINKYEIDVSAIHELSTQYTTNLVESRSGSYANVRDFIGIYYYISEIYYNIHNNNYDDAEQELLNNIEEKFVNEEILDCDTEQINNFMRLLQAISHLTDLFQYYDGSEIYEIIFSPINDILNSLDNENITIIINNAIDNIDIIYDILETILEFIDIDSANECLSSLATIIQNNWDDGYCDCQIFKELESKIEEKLTTEPE